MKRSWTGLIVLAALPLVGCQNKMHDELLHMHAENRELRGIIDQQNAELSRRPDSAELASLQGEISQRDSRIAELESQLRTPTPGAGAQPGIDGIETRFDAVAGTMTISMPGDVLFTSGSADLRPTARATLDKIAAALNGDYRGKAVRIEGHTDADPLVRTRNIWTDNLGLSLGRAAAVQRYLVSKGVEPRRIVTSGFGEHAPRGSDKATNRRVEIVVLVR